MSAIQTLLITLVGCCFIVLILSFCVHIEVFGRTHSIVQRDVPKIDVPAAQTGRCPVVISSSDDSAYRYPSVRLPEKLKKRMTGCFDIVDSFRSTCPRNQWRVYAPPEPGSGETFQQKSVVLSFSEEEAMETVGVVTIVVRLGSARGAAWIRQQLGGMQANCSAVAEVVIDWWPSEPFPEELQLLLNKFPVPARVIPETKGLGERAAVWLHVSTEFVLNFDDDKTSDCNEIQQLALIGRRYPTKMIGTRRLGRAIVWCPSNDLLGYRPIAPGSLPLPDNIMLHSASLIPVSALKAYFAKTPQAFIQLINQQRNCEDILLAFVMASMNEDGVMGVATSIPSHPVEKGARSGLSRKMNKQLWLGLRSSCLNLFRELLPIIPRPALVAIVEDGNV
eukprot:GHVS01097076.1.p1 GENE.GHVS01097076.1~~GHVS01097076.1.p1  ORF type:complete len:392 (-),score=36.78 GHVS01097076.1:816-1991(-)